MILGGSMQNPAPLFAPLLGSLADGGANFFPAYQR